MPPSVEVIFINHASVLVQFNGVKILSDPWYWGTTFKDGWALRYDNLEALEIAQTADYLWISHFHNDHLHMPTLKALSERNPEIIVLSNRSHNFSMTEIVKAAGFQSIQVLEERRPLHLRNNLVVTRFPATAIDNMLLIDDGHHRILNYNDCNLPAPTLRRLVKKMPPIDLGLFNLNHAGHLLQFPPEKPEEIKRRKKMEFSRKLDAANPKWALPFASHHMYISPEIISQNQSLLDSCDLAITDDRVVPWAVGDKVTFTDGFSDFSLNKSDRVTMTERVYPEVLETKPVDIGEMLSGLEGLRNRVNKMMLGVSRLVPAIRIYCPDLSGTVTVGFRGAPTFAEGKGDAQISAQSTALKGLYTSRFGVDAFVVGGHFEILNGCVSRLQAWLLVLNLVEQGVSLRELALAWLSRSGRSFLWARREEAVGVILGGSYKVGGSGRF